MKAYRFLLMLPLLICLSSCEEDQSAEQIEAQLDFSALEERFTGGDEYKTIYFKAWFERPFRKAAIKALSDAPMVKIEPRK
ncbi:MAG: hypothetical protein ACI9H8_001737 [Lysobacterales bacterium]|jgi:hypothetical protein